MKEFLVQWKNLIDLLKGHYMKLIVFLGLGQVIKIFTALAIPKVVQILFDSIQIQEISNNITNLFIAFIVIVILICFIAWMNIYGDAMATELGFLMVRNSFGKLYEKPVTDVVNKYTSGELYHRIQAGCHSSVAIWFSIVDLSSSIISLILVYCMIGNETNLYIVLIYLFIPIFTILYSAISFGWKKKISKNIQEKEAVQMNTLQEMVSNADFLKNFDATDWVVNKYQEEREDVIRLRRNYVKLETFLSVIQDFVDFIFTIAFGFLIRIPLTRWGTISITFLMYDNVKQKSTELYSCFTSLPNTWMPFKRLEEVLDYKSLSCVESKEDIVFENITLSYHDKKALDNIELTIKKGSKVAFMGMNGSGKTSLLKLASNMVQPTSGTMHNPYTTYEGRKSKVGFLTADLQLYNTTAFDNVSMAGDEIPDDAVDKRLIQMSISEHGDKMIENISMGEKQRVALCRALVKEGELLVLDEPTSSLDPSTSQRVIKEILNTKQTVLFATHNEEMAMLADQIVFMENGCIKRIRKN